LIYNLLTSSVSPLTGRHQSESVAVFTGMRILATGKINHINRKLIFDTGGQSTIKAPK